MEISLEILFYTWVKFLFRKTFCKIFDTLAQLLKMFNTQNTQNVHYCQKCESNRQKSLLNPWVWTLLLSISLYLPSQSTKKCLDWIINFWVIFNFLWESMTSFCLVLVKNSFNLPEFQYPGLFGPKPLLKHQ